MNLLLNEAITINREDAGGIYADGHYAAAADESPDPTGFASIQPLNGKELLQLPESDRIRHPVRIYTDVALQNDDTLIRDSDSAQFEIQKVENWNVFDMLQHFKAIGFLKDAQ